MLGFKGGSLFLWGFLWGFFGVSLEVLGKFLGFLGVLLWGSSLRFFFGDLLWGVLWGIPMGNSLRV